VLTAGLNVIAIGEAKFKIRLNDDAAGRM